MKRFAFLALCLAFAVSFAALGAWQLERLHWKLALIDHVETRLAAAPQDMPASSAWSDDDAYTRVRVRGVLLNESETLVQAVTERGPGWWVMTPLRTETGIVLINRGFVPSERASRRGWSRPDGLASVTGLLRASEPRGGYLRANAPEAGRWYSRDVDAIAHARGLSEPVAPFFIDADAAPNPGGYPVGGLTVVRFRNSHLAYAITWFALASLAVAGVVFVSVRHRPGGNAASR